MSIASGRRSRSDEISNTAASGEALRWMRGATAMEALLARLHREIALSPQGVESEPAVSEPAVSEPAVIEVVGLRKSYGSNEVLRGVDLRVAAGEVFCLLGPNGAGKTSTVEILEGFRSRSGGHVTVLGVDPEGQPARLRQRVGVVLQQCALPGELRVAELLDAYRGCYRAPLPLDTLLATVELEAQAGQLIRQLSGGQQRRVDLALALAGDPDLVFLDEPTTGFDPAARRRSWNAIRNLAALGKTILLTTHYLDEAQELADRVAVMVEGRVVACDSPQHLGDRHLARTRVAFELAPGADRNVPLTDGAVVEQCNDQWSISTGDPEGQLEALLSWARSHELRLTGLTVSPPSLEDIYLGLVGPVEEPGL